MILFVSMVSMHLIQAEFALPPKMSFSCFSLTLSSFTHIHVQVNAYQKSERAAGEQVRHALNIELQTTLANTQASKAGTSIQGKGDWGRVEEA